MNKSLSIIALSTILASSTLASTNASATGVEGLSANVGLVSQYFFRGIAQTSTATASAGLDYEYGNFSIGTWAADVEDGLEIDFYGAYSLELENGLGLSIGGTSYQYTGDFDSAYNEINLGASYGMFSVSYNVGQHKADSDLDIEKSDYSFLSATIEHNGFYGTVGTWGKDFSGEYIELGYGTEVSGIDLGVAVISYSKELQADWTIEPEGGDQSLVFSIGKAF